MKLDEYVSKFYKSDNEHVLFVQALAVRIFRLAGHHLPKRKGMLKLLKAAALLHDAGYANHPENHALGSRKLIMENGIDGMSPAEATIVALAAGYHNKRPDPLTDPDFLRLTPTDRQCCLAVAAVIRIADGLDYIQDQTGEIVNVVETYKGLRILYERTDDYPPDINLGRAVKKSDFWNAHLRPPVKIVTEKMPRPSPYIDPDETLATAGPKIVRFWLAEIRRYEQLVGHGEDIESVHRMRTATRRMQNALRIVGRAFDKRAIASLGLRLKKLAGLLGAVRDRDVFLKWYADYVAMAPGTHKASLGAVSDAWQSARTAALSQLVDFVASDEYAGTLREFGRFVGKPPLVPEHADRTVRKAAERSVKTLFTRVMAFRDDVKRRPTVEKLHELRIAVKRLRYSTELFRSCFRGGGKKFADTLRRIQDALGDLHDADVHRRMVADVAGAALTGDGDNPTTTEAFHRIVNSLEMKRKRSYKNFRTAWKKIRVQGIFPKPRN